MLMLELIQGQAPQRLRSMVSSNLFLELMCVLAGCVLHNYTTLDGARHVSSRIAVPLEEL